MYPVCIVYKSLGDNNNKFTFISKMLPEKEVIKVWLRPSYTVICSKHTVSRDNF